MSKKRNRRVIPLHELPPRPLAASLREGTDLACALIGGAYIENATGALLEVAMIANPVVNKRNVLDGLLNDPTGLLNTASARADMCYCLGLIDKITYANAKQIAKIRNQFAHSHAPIDFKSEEIGQLCDGLTVVLLDDTEEQVMFLEKTTQDRILAVPRYKFVLAACEVFMVITEFAKGVSYEDETGVIRLRARERPTGPIGRIHLATDSESFADAAVFFDE